MTIDFNYEKGWNDAITAVSAALTQNVNFDGVKVCRCLETVVDLQPPQDEITCRGCKYSDDVAMECNAPEDAVDPCPPLDEWEPRDGNRVARVDGPGRCLIRNGDVWDVIDGDGLVARYAFTADLRREWRPVTKSKPSDMDWHLDDDEIKL